MTYFHLASLLVHKSVWSDSIGYLVIYQSRSFHEGMDEYSRIRDGSAGNDNLEVQNWDMDIQNRTFVRLQGWHQHETN